MNGASLAAVSKILRHSDPKLTLEIYGHLAPGYLRDEIDKLSFGQSAASQPFVTRLLPDSENASSEDENRSENISDDARLEWSGQWDSNSRPPAPKRADRRIQGVTARSRASQLAEKIEPEHTPVSRAVQPVAAFRRPFSTRLLPETSAIADTWLTVREVAERLKVSTATVYKLIGRGDLEHSRIGNSIRIRAEALRRVLTK